MSYSIGDYVSEGRSWFGNTKGLNNKHRGVREAYDTDPTASLRGRAKREAMREAGEIYWPVFNKAKTLRNDHTNRWERLLSRICAIIEQIRGKEITYGDSLAGHLAKLISLLDETYRLNVFDKHPDMFGHEEMSEVLYNFKHNISSTDDGIKLIQKELGAIKKWYQDCSIDKKSQITVALDVNALILDVDKLIICISQDII